MAARRETAVPFSLYWAKRWRVRLVRCLWVGSGWDWSSCSARRVSTSNLGSASMVGWLEVGFRGVLHVDQQRVGMMATFKDAVDGGWVLKKR